MSHHRSTLAARNIVGVLAVWAGWVCDAVVALLFLAVAWPLWALPWRWATILGRVYGQVVFFFWSPGRRAGMINLRRAYGPDMTPTKARQAVFEVFGNMGQSLAEGAQFARRFKATGSRWEECYETEDPDLSRRLLADPRPKVFVTGHLGSWEVALGVAAKTTNARGAVIVRRIDNPIIDALFRGVRLRHPSQWIDKRGAISQAVRRLRAGENIALLFDENAGPRGVFVDYFGRPASTTKTPALLALVTGAPIVLGAAVRQADRRPFLYRVALFEPAAFVDRGPEGVRVLTEHLVCTYERWVRETPLQWRWIHWRWKYRPNGHEESYRREDVLRCFDEADESAAL